MTPGIVIVGGFLLIIAAGVAGYYFEQDTTGHALG